MPVVFSDPAIFRRGIISDTQDGIDFFTDALIAAKWTRVRTLDPPEGGTVAGIVLEGKSPQGNLMHLSIEDKSEANGGNQPLFWDGGKQAYGVSFRAMTVDETIKGAYGVVSCSGREQLVDACPGQMFTNRAGTLDYVGSNAPVGTTLQLGIPYVTPAGEECGSLDENLEEAWWFSAARGWMEDIEFPQYSDNYSGKTFRDHWRLDPTGVWSGLWRNGQVVPLRWRCGQFGNGYSDYFSSLRLLPWSNMYVQLQDQQAPPMGFPSDTSWNLHTNWLYDAGLIWDAAYRGTMYNAVWITIPNAAIPGETPSEMLTSPLDRVKVNFFGTGLDGVIYMNATGLGALVILRPGQSLRHYAHAV